MRCIVRSIEYSALVKLLLTKTYLINGNEWKENFVIDEHFPYILWFKHFTINFKSIAETGDVKIEMTALLQIAKELRLE